MDPAGGVALVEDVGDGREVDQVYAAGVLFDVPDMGVAEEVGLDLLARADDLEQGVRVLEAADSVTQTSKSAVSPTSKSACCPKFVRFAGLETCDTADLEVCATPRATRA